MYVEDASLIEVCYNPTPSETNHRRVEDASLIEVCYNSTGKSAA